MPLILENLQEAFGGSRDLVKIIAIDSDDSVFQYEDVDPEVVSVVRLGRVNLREYAERPNRNPVVAEILSGIPRESVLPTLEQGSGKVIPLTVAAWAALYSAPGGVVEKFGTALASLQARMFRQPGDRFRVLCVGSAFGGVGPIVPLLSAAYLRRVARNYDAMSTGLEISAVYVEPDPEEAVRNTRIAANTGACYSMLEDAQVGKFKVAMPGQGSKSLIGGERLFDHLFITGQVTAAGRIDLGLFQRGLAKFLVHWSGDPLSEDMRKRFADVHMREVTIDE